MNTLIPLEAQIVGLVIGSKIPLGLFFLSNLLFGWLYYLGRVLPRIRVSTDGLLTALVCIALLTIGLHRFAKWLTWEVAHNRGSTARWRWHWTAALLGLVVLMFAAGIAAAGIVHQAGWLLQPRTRPPERQYSLLIDERFRNAFHSSERHLKELGGGLEIVKFDEDSRIPWGKADPEGRVLHSWLTHLLVRGGLDGWFASGRIDGDRAWDDARNSAYFRGIVPPFLNPDIGRIRDARGYALSHFAGNRHVLGDSRPQRVQFAPAGTSQTIAAGEVAARFRAWGDPENLRDPGIGINTSEDSFGGPSGEGANLLFLDGSVRFVTRTVDPVVLQALSGARP